MAIFMPGVLKLSLCRLSFYSTGKKRIKEVGGGEKEEGGGQGKEQDHEGQAEWQL